MCLLAKNFIYSISKCSSVCICSKNVDQVFRPAKQQGKFMNFPLVFAHFRFSSRGKILFLFVRLLWHAKHPISCFMRHTNKRRVLSIVTTYKKIETRDRRQKDASVFFRHIFFPAVLMRKYL